MIALHGPVSKQIFKIGLAWGPIKKSFGAC